MTTKRNSSYIVRYTYVYTTFVAFYIRKNSIYNKLSAFNNAIAFISQYYNYSIDSQ